MSEIKGPRYKIDREIGRGAFGVVYLARDNVLRRNVALKVMSIPDGLSEEEQQHLVDRFYREARAAAGLSHPFIVTIHDISKARDKHFISMELLEGQPLSAAIGDKGLDLARALRIADGILAALEYAHEHEVVHRDIKPDNIFLMEDDSVKLVDFGLARVQASTTITRSGTVMGSPGYIAPEVIDGKTADKRTDVFSFGVVFYEMLTGARPFGPTDAFESFVRVIYRIMSEEQEAPSRLNPDVPPELDSLIRKTLAKDPEDRFQDAGELREALAEVVAGLDLPGEQPAPSRPKKEKKEAARALSSAALTTVTADALTADDAGVKVARDKASRTEIRTFEEDMIAEQARPKRRRRGLILAVGGGVLLACAIAVLLLFVLGVFETSQAKVPNVVNLAEAEAVKAIEQAGLKPGKIEDFFAYDIWKGKVASQKPSAGTVVPRGSTVDMKVSMGSEVAQVPDVVGQPKDQAAATVTAFTFKPKLVTGYSDTIPVDCVISEQPPPGTLKASGDVVTLVINSGVQPVGPPPTSGPKLPVIPKRSTPIDPRRK